MSKEISRRDLLKLVGLGGISVFIGGCGGTTQPTETGIPLKLKIEPTPTPAKIKEKEQGILWTQGLLIPPETSSGQLPEAFFTSQDKLFLSTPEGYPAAFNLAKGEKLWQWEDKATVYGAEPETVYVVRPDKRLYALDSHNGQPKWKAVFGVDESTNVGWPLWIGKETVHLSFSGRNFGIPYGRLAGVDKKNGNILWQGNQEYSGIMGLTEKTLVVLKLAGYPSWQGVDPLNGRKKWEVGSGLPYQTGQISENSLFYLIPDKKWVAGINPPNPSLVAIDIDSGRQLWQSQQTDINKILDISANRVYADYGGYFSPSGLTVIDRLTGQELWNWKGFGSDSHHFVGEIGGMTIL